MPSKRHAIRKRSGNVKLDHLPTCWVISHDRKMVQGSD